MSPGPTSDELPDFLAGDPWERELRQLLEEMDRDVEAVVVEGPRDRTALRTAGVDSAVYECSPGPDLVTFARSLQGDPITILTDYDQAGKRLNGRLRDLLPESRIETRWRQEIGLLLTQRGRYDIEALSNVFEPGLADSHPRR